MPAKSGLGSELWESASLGLTFINRRVPFARFLRLGGGLIACRFLPFKRAGFVCGRKSREDGIVIGRPFLNSCSDARASAPVDERSRPQIDPFRLPSLCGKACGDRMPGVRPLRRSPQVMRQAVLPTLARRSMLPESI